MTTVLTADQQARLEKVMAVPVHKGAGKNGIEDACIMQMTDWVYRNANHWTDKPTCVSPIITAFMIGWNDGMNDEDRQKLKPYIAKTIGTRTNPADERTRSYMTLDWYCRISAPTWLRLIGKEAEAKAIECCEPIVDAKSAKAATEALRSGAEVARAARDAAGAAAGAAAWAAARDAARDAAWAAARDAARAAAWDAARDAAWDAARDVAWDALRPVVEELQISALGLLEAMIAVGAEATVHAV